ncbi:MAG: hypothetical protein R8M45_08780 [Ghiorsea sp.]
MSCSADFLKHLPPLPSKTYVSHPVYFEPIQGSGERFTVLIAVISPEVVIHKTMRQETVEAMLGSRAASFLGMIDLCAKSLAIHLKDEQSFETWQPPTSGFHKGKAFEEFSDNSTDTLRVASQFYASMGFLPSIADFEEEPVKAKRDRWLDLVEKELEKQAPSLLDYTRQKFRVSNKARETAIDYIGRRYAANLGKLDPGQQFTAGIRAAKAKMWDMEALRESRGSLLSDRVSSFELILWRPDFNSPAYSERQINSLKEALHELEEEGDKRELRVYQAETSDLAAKRIILQEAA